MENEFEKNSLAVVEKGKQIVIRNNEDYKNAGEFLKQVKAQEKVIVEHFAEMKEQAHKAHKAICDKENAYLKPLKTITAEIKELMSKYSTEQENKRIEAMLRLAQEKEKLVETLKASGQDELAEQIAESQNSVVASEIDSISGISSIDNYEIVITDATKVPSYINGVEIRTIDLTAIKQLAKANKGNLKIDGIEIRKSKQIRVRS